MLDMLTYQVEANYRLDEMLALYRASGIQRPIEDRERMTRMLSSADLLLTARLDGKLVGLARVLTDRAWVCYVADLLVDRSVQRRGIGRTLLEKLSDEMGPSVQQLLLSALSAMEYYPKVGFTPLQNAFAIPRHA